MNSSNVSLLLGTVLCTLRLLGWSAPSEDPRDFSLPGTVQIILFHLKDWIFGHCSTISCPVNVYVCMQVSVCTKISLYQISEELL